MPDVVHSLEKAGEVIALSLLVAYSIIKVLGRRLHRLQPSASVSIEYLDDAPQR